MSNSMIAEKYCPQVIELNIAFIFSCSQICFSNKILV
jgi:hypothetical protein